MYVLRDNAWRYGVRITWRCAVRPTWRRGARRTWRRRTRTQRRCELLERRRQVLLLVRVLRVLADLVEQERHLRAAMHRRDEQIGELQSVAATVLLAVLRWVETRANRDNTHVARARVNKHKHIQLVPFVHSRYLTLPLCLAHASFFHELRVTMRNTLIFLAHSLHTLTMTTSLLNRRQQ